MEEIGRRRGELTTTWNPTARAAPVWNTHSARGLIGFQSDFMNDDARHRPDEPRVRRLRVRSRPTCPVATTACWSAQDNGEAVAYALWKLADRGPHVRIARRQAVRRHDHRHPTRDNDLVVNPIKGKQLTNVRLRVCERCV